MPDSTAPERLPLATDDPLRDRLAELRRLLQALRAIIDLKPQRVVCLDLGFSGNDALKTNAVLEMKSHGVEFATA
jgi:adenine-specific DNA-methyltransferase